MKIFGKTISKHALFRIGAILLTLLVLGTSAGIYAKYVREVRVKGTLKVDGAAADTEAPDDTGKGLDETEAPEVTEGPVITDEPEVTDEPVITEEPEAVPEIISFEARAELAPVGGEDLDCYLYIELGGDAVPGAEWLPVEGARGRHGGSVYVYANGGLPVIVDPGEDGGIIVNADGALCVRVSYEASAEAEVFGCLVPAYDGETPASLYNDHQ